MSKCSCVFATSKNTSSVRSGHEVGGYLKKECSDCAGRKELQVGVVPDLIKSLEACAQELSAMIRRYNERSPIDGSFLYDEQTVCDAYEAIARAKGEK